MYKNVIKYGDREISSGSAVGDAIKSLRLESATNDGAELRVGSACCDVLTAEIISRGGSLSITDGTRIELYHEINGERTLDGTFVCTEPVRKSQNIYKLTAYDLISQSDRDVSRWIYWLAGWPYTLARFSQLVASQCDLELANTPPINGDYLIQKFSGTGITGRKLLKWCAEIAGCYIKALPDGRIAFKWYEQSSSELTPGGENYYFGGSLKYADYSTAKIDGVRIKGSTDDVGASFPDTALKNAYDVVGNPLLAASDPKTVAPVAEALYNRLKGISYVPCKVKIPAERTFSGIKPGSIVNITDGNGRRIQTYVFKMSRSGHSASIESTGSLSRASITAVNDVTIGSISQKMFEVRRSIDGLSLRASEVEASNTEAVRKVAELAQTVDGFEVRVSSAEETANSASTRVAELSVSVDGISSRVSSAESTANSANEAASSAQQTADSVSVEVEKKLDSEAGDWTSFGWKIDTNKFSVFSQSHTVLGVTDAGAEIDGKVTAREGQIGNVLIKKYNPETGYGGYLKVGGLSGYATYIGEPNKSLFDKYVIVSGPDNDIEDDYTFRLSAKGELHSTAGEIGGFSIGAHSLTTRGATWENAPSGGIYLGSSGLNISNNCWCNANGDFHAKTGTFEGTIYAKGISYGGDSGYVSGKCLSNNSVTTVETSTGINESLNFANYANDVFHNRVVAPYVRAKIMSTEEMTFGKDGVNLIVDQKTISTPSGAEVVNFISWK